MLTKLKNGATVLIHDTAKNIALCDNGIDYVVWTVDSDGVASNGHYYRYKEVSAKNKAILLGEANAVFLQLSGGEFGGRDNG